MTDEGAVSGEDQPEGDAHQQEQAQAIWHRKLEDDEPEDHHDRKVAQVDPV
jgi:hypothetical protein